VDGEGSFFLLEQPASRTKISELLGTAKIEVTRRMLALTGSCKASDFELLQRICRKRSP
jgi:hypothetical protein